MNWVDHTIWWHVYPLGFVGAPIRGERPAQSNRGLLTLVDWLDYAVELGVSGLLLGPIFTSSTHGYDSLNQFEIDPRLGGEGDFTELVSQCHRRGMRILLDGVFSHVGAEHPRVQNALKHGPNGPDGLLFDIDWTDDANPRPRVFEGHGSLVRLDHAGDAARQYARQVMTHWLDRGIDGWRLDAAYSVPTEFWRDVLKEVRQSHPQAWFLGEVIHGDYPEFVRDSTVDSVTQYELWKAIWSSLLDVNFFELAWALERNNEFLECFTPNTFIGNHDVTRIASKVGSQRALLALTALMTVGGIPSIYYGDEQGFTGVKENRADGDDAIRPPMPPTPSDLLPYGRDMYVAHQELIGLRRRHPWLVTSRAEILELSNARIAYRSTEAGGDDFIDTTLEINGERVHANVRSRHGEELWSRTS